jgi:hypothetical protein
MNSLLKTSKTILSLQWLKQQDLPVTKAAYFSLDDLYYLQLPVFSLNEILKDASTLKKQLPNSFRPLEYFNEY